ncbi:MAG: gamma-butyrobetaine hydroxylase-like domain-containing protein [Chlorobiota bacterium]
MSRINPIKIERPKPYLLQAEWADGKKAMMTLEMFRRECPCAYCKGEKVGNKVYSHPVEVKDEPGAFDLEYLKPIGNYALAVKWKNGHDTGIYTWDYFREIMVKNDVTGNEESLAQEEKKYDKNKKKIKLDVL